MSPLDRILQLGEPQLRVRSSNVDLEHDGGVDGEAATLMETLGEFQRQHGFGRAISAPQIGVAKRFVAIDLERTGHGNGKAILWNPKVYWRSDAMFSVWDDCMSFPDLLVRVRRCQSISVRYQDRDGSSRSWERLDPATSELLQHEIDHLDGILAVDRAEGASALATRVAFERNHSRQS